MAELDVQTDGAVAVVRFERPDQGNAVTPALAQALSDALERLAASACRVVVLTGSGSSFNVGSARTPAAASCGASRSATYRSRIPLMHNVITLLRDTRWVSIAAINGACAGAGLALALACDLRYAAATARFNTGFLSSGLPSELGAAWFASRIVGTGRASELFLLPDRADAASLRELGLLNGVYESDELMSAVGAKAARIAEFAPSAVRGMKADLGRTELPFEDYLSGELATMLACLDAPATGTAR